MRRGEGGHPKRKVRHGASWRAHRLLGSAFSLLVRSANGACTYLSREPAGRHVQQQGNPACFCHGSTFSFFSTPGVDRVNSRGPTKTSFWGFIRKTVPKGLPIQPASSSHFLWQEHGDNRPIHTRQCGQVHAKNPTAKKGAHALTNEQNRIQDPWSKKGIFIFILYKLERFQGSALPRSLPAHTIILFFSPR